MLCWSLHAIAFGFKLGIPRIPGIARTGVCIAACAVLCKISLGGMMSEVKRIADQLRRSYEGPAWHGPSLKEILKGVTAEQAAARPIPKAHSIWEIVLHISAWQNVAGRRIEEGVLGDPGEAEDWPPVGDVSESAWEATLRDLDRNQMALRETIDRLDDARLSDALPARNYSVYILLHGV